jgi:MFS family permease
MTRMVRPRFTTPNRILLLLCAMYFLLFVDRVNLATAAPSIQTELGLSNTQLGIVFSAFAYPYALFQLLGGAIGDRFGPRLTLAVSLVVVCIATALTGIIGGFASLFAVRLALGFGEGCALPTATRAMSSWIPESQWGFAQGITHTFARLGLFLTPPIVALLIAWFSWRASFFIVAGISLLWLLVFVWYFRDEPREHPGITQEDIAILPARARAKGSRNIPWFKLARFIAPVTAVDFCYGWTLWIFQSWLPSFFVQNYQLNLGSTALYSAGVLFAGVVGDTLGGLVSDWLLHRTGNIVFARRAVIVTGFTGAFIFLIPVMLVDDLTTAAICLSLAFFFAELIVAPIWAVPMDIAPRYAGTASGMMNFGFGLAGIVSPLFFGTMIDLTGTWTVPFAVSIGLLMLGAALTFTLRPDIAFVEEEEKTAAPVRAVPQPAP